MDFRRFMGIVWPAFLSACVLELVVFAMVDPQDLNWSGAPLDLSRQAIYTAAFFIFWGISMVGGALTTLLALPPAEVNGCPVAPDDRPEGCAHR